MFHMMTYKEKRQKKSRMASAIIDLKGPVKGLSPVPMKKELNTTYEITDESMNKFKQELEEIMENVNRVPVHNDDVADHTILKSSDEVSQAKTSSSSPAFSLSLSPPPPIPLHLARASSRTACPRLSTVIE